MSELNDIVNWQRGNLTTSFPFLSAGLSDKLAPGDIRTLVAEAVFEADVKREDDTLYLKSLDLNADPEQPQQVEIRWKSDDVVFFDSTAEGVTCLASTWGSWLICEWRQPEDSGRFVKLLVSAEALTEFSFPFTPVEQPLFAPTCLIRRSSRLGSVSVRNPPFGAETPLQGTLRLAEGYNTQLETEQKVVGLRRRTVITVNAVPGAGAGKAPGCIEEDPYPGALRLLGGAAADVNGNVSLQSETGCYLLGRPIEGDHAALVPAALSMTSSCVACCSCEQYVRVYEQLKKISDYLADIKARFPRLASRLQVVAEKITARIQCARTRWLVLKLYALPGWLVGAQGLIINQHERTDLCEVWAEFTFTSMARLAYVPKSFYVTSMESGGKRVQIEPYQTETTINTIVVGYGLRRTYSLILRFEFWPRMVPSGMLMFSMLTRADKSCRSVGWPVECRFVANVRGVVTPLQEAVQTVALKESHPR